MLQKGFRLSCRTSFWADSLDPPLIPTLRILPSFLSCLNTAILAKIRSSPSPQILPSCPGKRPYSAAALESVRARLWKPSV